MEITYPTHALPPIFFCHLLLLPNHRDRLASKYVSPLPHPCKTAADAERAQKNPEQTRQRNRRSGGGSSSGSISSSYPRSSNISGAHALTRFNQPIKGVDALGLITEVSSTQATGSLAYGGTDVPSIDSSSMYTLQFDGGSRGNPGPSGAGAVLFRCGVCIPSGYALQCARVRRNTGV